MKDGRSKIVTELITRMFAVEAGWKLGDQQTRVQPNDLCFIHKANRTVSFSRPMAPGDRRLRRTHSQDDKFLIPYEIPQKDFRRAIEELIGYKLREIRGNLRGDGCLYEVVGSDS